MKLTRPYFSRIRLIWRFQRSSENLLRMWKREILRGANGNSRILPMKNGMIVQQPPR